jgi:hypothetical protein
MTTSVEGEVAELNIDLSVSAQHAISGLPLSQQRQLVDRLRTASPESVNGLPTPLPDIYTMDVSGWRIAFRKAGQTIRVLSILRTNQLS